MPWHRPFDDGIKDHRVRSKLRREAWRDAKPDKPTHRATERLCSECSKWFRVDSPNTWCEHLRYIPNDVDAPNVLPFKPYYNPNIQEGGAWLETRAKERECMRLNNKAWKH